MKKVRAGKWVEVPGVWMIFDKLPGIRLVVDNDGFYMTQQEWQDTKTMIDAFFSVHGHDIDEHNRKVASGEWAAEQKALAEAEKKKRRGRP